MAGRLPRNLAGAATWRAAPLLIGALVVIAGLWYLVDRYVLSPVPRIVIRNDTAQTLAVVEAVLDYGGGGTTTERIGDLGPGQGHRFSPAANDFHIRLLFVVRGREYVHHEALDLEEARTYAFAIQPDGHVESGYEGQDGPER